MKQFFYKANRQQQLRGFLYTAKFGSFSKAANHMRVGQPTVSVQVKSLEQELGVILFERKTRQAKLTPDGQSLYELAVPLLEQFDRIYEIFHEQRIEREDTQLRVAANHGSIEYILPNYVKRFLEKNEQAQLSLHYARQEQGLEKLRHREVDLFITPRNFSLPKEFSYQPLFEFKPVAILSRKHVLAKRKKISLKELTNFELTLLPESVTVIPGLHELILRENESPSSRLQFIDWEMVIRYVEVGLCVTVGSEFLVRNNSRCVGVPLKDKLPNSQYGMVLLKAANQTELSRRFTNTLIQS